MDIGRRVDVVGVGRAGLVVSWVENKFFASVREYGFMPCGLECTFGELLFLAIRFAFMVQRCQTILLNFTVKEDVLFIP